MRYQLCHSSLPALLFGITWREVEFAITPTKAGSGLTVANCAQTVGLQIPTVCALVMIALDLEAIAAPSSMSSSVIFPINIYTNHASSIYPGRIAFIVGRLGVGSKNFGTYKPSYGR